MQKSGEWEGRAAAEQERNDWGKKGEKSPSVAPLTELKGKTLRRLTSKSVEIQGG